MPLAKTHDKITVVTGLALAPLAYVTLLRQSQSTEVAMIDTVVFVGAHWLSGIMFSPDLHIDSAIDNRWWIFYWIWRPYMWAMPHGRPWSHGLIFAPLLRLLYFFVVLLLLFLGVAWILGRLGITVPDYHVQAINALVQLARTRPREVIVFLIGFITGSAAHSIADWLVTNHSHHLRRVGIRVKKDYAHHDHRTR